MKTAQLCVFFFLLYNPLSGQNILEWERDVGPGSNNPCILVVTWSLKPIIFVIQPKYFFSIKWCIRFLPYSKYQYIYVHNNLLIFWMKASPSFLTPKNRTKKNLRPFWRMVSCPLPGRMGVSWQFFSCQITRKYPKIPWLGSMGRLDIYIPTWMVDLYDKLVGKYIPYTWILWVSSPLEICWGFVLVTH